MKRLVIVLALLLLVGGGGAAAWWTFLRAEDEEAVEAPEPPPTPAFVEFTPLVLPIILDGQVTQHVTLKIQLEVDAEQEEMVRGHMPRLTDAYFSELHALLAMRYVREQPNVLPLLQKRLQAVSDRLLGRGTVGRVSILEVNRRQPTRS